MNETHRTYCRNAAIELLAEIDADPDYLTDPMLILDRAESYAYSPHPRLTIEHAFDRIIAELIDLRPELEPHLEY